MSFSTGLSLTDLNDYISPSQSCIKPVEVNKKSDIQQAIKIDQTGDYYEVAHDGTSTKLETASISLNDCLACSGCITSAESVLIALQSHKELLDVLDKNRVARDEGRLDDVKVVIVSISPQTYATFASKYSITLLQTAQRITSVLKNLGVDHIFDTSFSRDLSLIRIAREFVDRYRTAKAAPRSATRSETSLPMLASACPGWVCYAEKTHDYVLPYISKTKSPQQIMGSLTKFFFADKLNTQRQVASNDTLSTITPDRIYHLSIMPCYDKKLEASREDFFIPDFNAKEVDCVISSGELDKLMEERGIDFPNVDEVPLDRLFTKRNLARAAGTSSGGYLEYILSYSARELFGLDLKGDDVERGESSLLKIETVRNADFREVSLILPDGSVGLRFAATYGFRNIQTLMRKIKIRRCQYDFVEVMACPSGCINGGGQLKPGLLESITPAVNGSSEALGNGPLALKAMKPKEWIQLCERVYRTLPTQDPMANLPLQDVVHDWFGEAGLDSQKAERFLATKYRALERESTITAVVGW
ncbi:iron hydrogenase [Dimargaris cristalligena]|uniref:Iron hydrogenase n=1 Tax=Dimargaris cristalligena TaxID=215637 RepID=A0A4P9ZZN6_9FUNG|nr:iron hydrogenase [Dimargaris cristalligena]|eukprot:RKP39177.1 iron hydrogenase [Dimargaris cristalligena]